MNKNETLRMLRQQLQDCELLHHQSEAACVDGRISSGCLAFDEWLPRKGFFPGQLVEWIVDRASARGGHGAGLLALLIARQAAEQNPKSMIVILDSALNFHPPTAAAWGLDLRRTIVVQPQVPGRAAAQQQADLVWAIDQSLRCPAVCAVWCNLPTIDDKSFRRLQLAVEQGGGLGLLLRDHHAQHQPSWAHLQIGARTIRGPSASDGLYQQLRLLRGRGAKLGTTLHVQLNEAAKRIEWAKSLKQNNGLSMQNNGLPENFAAKNICHETHPLPLAAQLARPTSDHRSPTAHPANGWRIQKNAS